MSQALCFRCEYRAQFNETGSGPRCECGDIKLASHGCYMYKPVKPLIVEPIKGEDRPLFVGAMFSGRMQATGIAEGDYIVVPQNKKSVVYFQPKTDKKVKKK